MTLNEAIQIMTNEIATVLADNKPTIYLFGSVALDDFQLGAILTSLFLLIAGSQNSRQKLWSGFVRLCWNAIPATRIFGCLRVECFQRMRSYRIKKKERSIGEQAVSALPTAIKWTASAWQNCLTAVCCCTGKIFVAN